VNGHTWRFVVYAGVFAVNGAYSLRRSRRPASAKVAPDLERKSGRGSLLLALIVTAIAVVTSPLTSDSVYVTVNVVCSGVATLVLMGWMISQMRKRRRQAA
jgi:hypothetical protein